MAEIRSKRAEKAGMAEMAEEGGKQSSGGGGGGRKKKSGGGKLQIK